jgi:hypothetical protein
MRNKRINLFYSLHFRLYSLRTEYHGAPLPYQTLAECGGNCVPMCSKKCSEIGNLTKLFIYVRLSLYNPKDDEDGALCPPPTQSARGKRERERDKNARNPALLGNLFDFSGFYYPFIDEERPGQDDCFTGGIQNCRDVIIAHRTFYTMYMYIVSMD